MSSSTEMLQLQLGDIIQIESPTNDNYDNKIFLITYIDQKEIEIQNITTLAKKSLILDDEGEIDDQTIDNIETDQRQSIKKKIETNG